MKKYLTVLCIIFLLVNSTIHAQKNVALDTMTNNISVTLVTIGPGHDLTSWWGHTAIIVEDQGKGESKFYNYGLFSFEEDNFVLNFIMGRLIFWVGAWRTPNALAYYRGLDRDIRFQILNLSQDECKQIKEFLENNVKPENARYLYDHYYDNCSTRIRDIFDRTTNGKLREIGKEKSRMTLREHTRRHTYHDPIMDFLLMFLMNDTIDKPITVWDDMFLPSEMEQVLDRVEYKSETGELKNIVKDKRVYYKSKTVPSLPDRAPAHWPYTLILGLILGVISLILAYLKKDKLFFVYNLIIGLLFGFIGTVLFFLSSFTDHIVTYFNENLFLANPITLLVFPLSILVLRNREKYYKWFYYSWWIIIIIALVGTVLKILPSFDQDNSQAITLILPILFGCFISTLILKNKHN
jgi:multisubunit Na+/H+ antiporter MnhF subunit